MKKGINLFCSFSHQVILLSYVNVSRTYLATFQLILMSWSFLVTYPRPICQLEIITRHQLTLFPPSLSISLFLSLSLSFSLHPPIPRVYPSIRPQAFRHTTNPSVRPSVRPSIYPPYHSPIRPSVRPPACLPCLSAWSTNE